MKKIHITEAQMKALKDKLSEAVTVDATSEVEQANGNVSTAWNNMKTKNPMLDQQAKNGEVTVGVNPEGIDEGKTVTKRQIKEAKIRKMQNESVCIKKKDIK